MEIGGRQMCNVGARVDSVLYTLVHIPETITANKERGPLIFGPIQHCGMHGGPGASTHACVHTHAHMQRRL